MFEDTIKKPKIISGKEKNKNGLQVLPKVPDGICPHEWYLPQISPGGDSGGDQGSSPPSQNGTRVHFAPQGRSESTHLP